MRGRRRPLIRGRRSHPTPPPWRMSTLPLKGRRALRRGGAETDLVLLGEFGRAHGLKGEVRLKSHTGDPLAIASYGPLRRAKGPQLTRSEIPGRPRAARPTCWSCGSTALRRAKPPRRSTASSSSFARDKLPDGRGRGRVSARRPDRLLGPRPRRARRSAPSWTCRISAAATFWKSSRRPAARRRFCPSPGPSCREVSIAERMRGRDAAGRPVRTRPA